MAPMSYSSLPSQDSAKTSSFIVVKTSNRVAFTRHVLSAFRVPQLVAGRRVLVKPNIVSHEPYPTTTHPQMLDTLLEALKNLAGQVAVADGPAPDAGPPQDILREHPLSQVCKRHGVPLLNIFEYPFTTHPTPAGFTLEVSDLPKSYDYVISLPVLKEHPVAQMTGALKNQFGLLSAPERSRLHRGQKDIHRAIVEVTRIAPPNLTIMDCVETLIGGNERRWGGRQASCGFLLAGTDPVALDIQGQHILSRLAPGLRSRPVRHLQLAQQHLTPNRPPQGI